MGGCLRQYPPLTHCVASRNGKRMGGSDDGADVGRGKDKKSDNGTERGCDVP